MSHNFLVKKKKDIIFVMSKSLAYQQQRPIINVIIATGSCEGCREGMYHSARTRLVTQLFVIYRW